MTKDIAAAALGFLTLPIIVGLLTAFGFTIKYATSFDLSAPHYWGGFWSLIGVVVVVCVCGGLFFFITEFRNL